MPLAISLREPATVELVGWNIPDSAKKIVVKPDRVSDRWWINQLGVANPVAVRVEPHRCLVEVEPNGRSRPQIIEVPATITGRIDPAGDLDVFNGRGKRGND